MEKILSNENNSKTSNIILAVYDILVIIYKSK